jgi:uncharacterized protein YcfJ
MFDSSQRLDPDAELPALAVATAELSTLAPGGSALASGARLRALLVMRRRLDAQFLAELASFDGQGFGEAYGFASTQAWLRGYGNLDSGQAGSLVASARTADRLPLVAEVLTEGRIGVEHVAAIARSTRRVPEDVLVEHDHTLRDMTGWARPSDLSGAGQKITECWDHDAADADANHLADSRRLSLAQTFNGIWALEGALTAEDGVKLAAALEPLMRKRGPEDDRTPTQRRVDALAELVDIALRSGQLPDAGGDRTRITLLVHATAAALDLVPDDLDGLPDPEDWDVDLLDPDDVDPADLNPLWHDSFLHDSFLHDTNPLLLPEATTTGDRAAGDQGPTIPDQRGRAVPEPDWLHELTGHVIGTIAGDFVGDLLGDLSGGIHGDLAGKGVGNIFAGSRVAAAFGDGASARQLLGSHAELTVEALTRIGCDAEINLMMLDAGGEVMHCGHSTRFPLVGQRRALVVRDQGCVFPGCDRPPSACQAHHLKFWSHHGPTDIENLALVCSFHHWLIHDRHWVLERIPPEKGWPTGGWLAKSPAGLQLTRHRQPSG